MQENGHERRVPAQILVTESPMAAEAENAAEIAGAVAAVDLPEASGGKVASFTGNGSLTFDMEAEQGGKYALWLRARWDSGADTSMMLQLDGTEERRLRPQAMIGFTNWTNPNQAHTKMFAHFGEQYGHWSWYRVPDVDIEAGKHQLQISARAGAEFDALILLPQNPVMDRAAMNLFQNWNYEPWDNPM